MSDESNKIFTDIDELRDRVGDHSIRIALLEQSISSLKDSMKGVHNGIRWLVFLVASGLITALINFMVNGGLNIN